MYIKSPLNYTGNKHRLLKDIYKNIPDNINTFVDLFCGGGSVGINSKADNIILVDKNIRVIGLLKYLSETKFETILSGLLELVSKYNLTCTYKYGYEKYKKLKKIKDNNGYRELNREGFIKLRNDYNSIKNKNTKKANLYLYLLLLYGFNNDLRFNSKGEYNLPIGKTDLNKTNVEKLRIFNEHMRSKNVKFICGDFRDIKVREVLFASDFFYADPPYLITTAVYNESSGWTESDEVDFLNLLNEAIEKDKPFAVSNVLRKNSKSNTFLESWLVNTNEARYIDIDYHYRSSNYQKKNRLENEEEILILGGLENELVY